MHPVLRRVLIHGGLTAAILGLVGVMFAELASVWLAGNAPRGADAAAGTEVGATLRARVPLMLAVWGFVFVLVGEVVIWRVRGGRPAAKPPETPQDDAEKLLNELLAQAESRMALEQGSGQPGSGDRGQGSESSSQESAGTDERAQRPADPA